MIFNKKDPKNELEGIKRAQQILDERYEKKLIPYEIYIKQSQEFNKRKEKYMKKLGLNKYDVY